MSKIYIHEVDLSTVSNATQDMIDVVYVPGFSSASSDSLTVAKKGVPTLCRTISEFNAYFGANPALFNADQAYPSGASGFAAVAIPTVNSSAEYMFLKGSPDPSYIYAKELLSRGIPVLYERVNDVSDATSGSYDVTVAKMYEFLASAFISKADTEPSTTITGGTATVADKATFLAAYPEAGTHVFTYKAADAEAGITAGWYHGSDSTNIGADSTALGTAIGVTYTGTATAGNTITVVLYYEQPTLLDKSTYEVKYLTSGGYPTFEFAGKSVSQAMTNLAAERGDCIVLIDHTNNPHRNIVGTDSVYYQSQQAANKLSAATASYGAMFTPYGTFALANTYLGITSSEAGFPLPPSFAYLSCLATSIATNPAWLAIAGATRGKVTDLISVNSDKILTNAIADSYVTDTSVAINPITNVRPYGQCIWGNRTLFDNSVTGGTKALSYLNIRNLVCDIKKQLFDACQSLLFEPNSDILWANFTSRVTPLLDQMKSGQGIGNYKISRVNPSDRAQITAIVRIYPVYSVEAFDLTLYIQNGELDVQE